MLRSRIGFIVQLAAIFVLLPCMGCDTRPRRVPVAGRVLIDGKPLSFGVVQVWPADGRQANAMLDKDGRFRFTTYDEHDGCLLGTHPIAVIAREQITPTKMYWHTPKKYARPESSELTVTIEKPMDDLLIELTWAGGKPFYEVDVDSGDGGEGVKNATEAGQN